MKALQMSDRTSRFNLRESDPAIYEAIRKEMNRQQNTIDLIASENIASPAVLEAAGSTLTNKYAEGYSGRRYYGGCRHVDEVENLAIDRLKRLFNAQYANVQPHSGASANLAAFVALLTPGDTFMGMSLAAGGHLTHGSPVTISGKWFKPVAYGVNSETGLVDYDEVEAIAQQHKPKLIIAGGSAYSRIIDFKRFRAIADSIDAFLMVDMAHFSGLVAGGVYPNPLPHAHVVTSTTHKTLRGPRGGIILSNDMEIGARLSSAIFPGSQGGPLMHIIAAKAVAFGEALSSDFKGYVSDIIRNAQALVRVLKTRGFSMVSGGTDTHLVLVDLRSKSITGAEAEATLERAGIICNKNSIPNDPLSPKITSGIRIGTPTITTRGFRENDCEALAGYIADILEGYVATDGKNDRAEQQVSVSIQRLCQTYPIYTRLRQMYSK